MGLFDKQWLNYLNNYKNLMAYGTFVGLVEPFDEEIFKRLRNVYYNNIPAVLLLLDNNLVQRHCYERARLIAYGLNADEFEVVTANIDGLKYNPSCLEKYITGKIGENYAEHCYVKAKKDGRVWVYDTSLGYRVESGLYEDIQKPEIKSTSREPIDLEEIGIKEYNDEELMDNSIEIRNNIEILKETLYPVKEEYKELILRELKEIDKKLNNTEDYNGKYREM